MNHFWSWRCDESVKMKSVYLVAIFERIHLSFLVHGCFKKRTTGEKNQINGRELILSPLIKSYFTMYSTINIYYFLALNWKKELTNHFEYNTT